MSVSADLQQFMTGRLTVSGELRLPLPVLARREKDLAAEIEAATARSGGLCIYALPVLPLAVIDDFPFVFVSRGEARVRIIEQPGLNLSGVNAFQLAEDVARGLHWQNGNPLAAPLQLAARCTEAVSDARWRIVDVIFNAAYQLPRRTLPALSIVVPGQSLAEDLQTVVRARLFSGLTATVPVLEQRTHDLAVAIETSGHPLSIEVQSPRPNAAMQGNDEVFFEGYEVRVTIKETPALNAGPWDAYDLIEDVMDTLHWRPFTGLLAHPLQLAATPTVLRDSPARREIEVIFSAATGFAEGREVVVDDAGILVTDDAGVAPLSSVL